MVMISGSLYYQKARIYELLNAVDCPVDFSLKTTPQIDQERLLGRIVQ